MLLCWPLELFRAFRERWGGDFNREQCSPAFSL